MKKIFLRIFAFTFALYISFLSIFNSFHVKVYASALPEIPQDFGSNFTIIEGMPNSSSQYTGLPSIAVEAALMKLAEPGGAYEGLVAHEELAIKIASDFIAKYGDDAFRIAVAQPAEAVQNLFWNYPNQAVQACLDATNAGIVIIADEYVSFSDALINNIKDFAQAHIKHNVYYSDITGSNENLINKFSYSQPFYISGSVSPYGAFSNNIACSMNENGGYFYVINSTEFYSHVMQIWVDANMNVYYQGQGTSNIFPGYSTNIPIYNEAAFMTIFAVGNHLKDKWWEDSDNWIEIEPNIVQPVTKPIPIECPDIYHLPELYPWIGDIPVPSIDPSKQPDHDPDGYPIIEPDPIPIPDPAPVPVPPTVPIPNPVDPDPVPGPVDPDPTPTPVDPDPVPDPVDPDPDDPDPDDPDPDDPDPDKPDPDFDFPDDWGGSPLMDLSGFFPFCLPMDLYLAFTMLTAEAEPPVFEIPVNISLSGVNQSNYQDVIVIDIIQPAGQGSGSAEPYVKYLRFFLTFLFIVFLIFTSIKITPH